MKKLLLLLLCLFLPACTSQVRPSDAMAATLTALDRPPENYHIYYSDASESSPHFPSAEIKKKLYSSGYDVDALCEGYAVLVGNGDLPYEIHLLKARSHSNIADLLDCLNERKELLSERKNSTYNPDTIERTRSSFCYCAGKYAVLLVTDDNEGIQKTLSEYIL